MPTRQEVLTKVREKYPQYKDIPDDDLASSLSKKYPVYAESLFDADGSDYDYATAKRLGMSPDPETKHWGSRIDLPAEEARSLGLPPGSGIMLKGAKHETWDKALEGEEKEGFEVVKGQNGRYYSIPKSSQRLKQNQDLEEMLGGKMINPESGELAYSDEDRARDEKNVLLSTLEKEQRTLADENQGREDRLSSGKLESATAGVASVPTGLVSLGSLALEKALERITGKPVPKGLKPVINEELRNITDEVVGEIGAANPTTAGLSAVGTQLASMGGVGGIGQLLAKGALKAAVKEFGKNAAINTAIGEGLRRVTGEETEGRDVALDFALGLAGGRNRRGEKALIEAGENTVGAVQSGLRKGVEKVEDLTSTPRGWIERQFENRRINQGDKQAQRESVEYLMEEAANKVSSPSATATLPGVSTSSAKAKQAVQKFLSTGGSVDENLQLQRDANLAINSTKGELGLLSRMIKEGEEHAVDFDKPDPMLIVGQEFMKRAKSLKELRSKYGKELGESVKDIPKDALTPKIEETTIQTPEGPAIQRTIRNSGVDPKLSMVKRMNEISELEGLSVSPDGNLDFSETSLRGERFKSVRQAIQNDFDEVTGMNPLQIHRKRQELFDVVNKVPYNERGLSEKGMNAMRQGLADVLEMVSPKYKELNRKVATIIEPLDELSSYLKLSDEANVPTNLLENEAAILARRLNSNAISNPRVAALINQLESRLAEEGIKFDTRLSRVQQMYNMMNRYYPEITRETSLQGQVRAANIPTSKGEIIKSIGQDFATTPSVRKKYLKDLIESLQ